MARHAEEKLRAANSWLSLVGRYPLKPGPNTFGTGKNNDVIFPAPLAGLGPERLGTLDVDPKAKKVTLKLSDGVSMTSGGKPFTGERVLGTRTDKRDWVSLGRLSMHLIARGGNYVLRLADNESPLRTHFPGCVWYPPDEAYKLEAKFVPYPAGRTLSIVNIIGETSQQPCPGYAEFQLHGQTHRLDAIAEDGGLFFVFRDATAGDTTYAASRFLDIAKQPPDNASFHAGFQQGLQSPLRLFRVYNLPAAAEAEHSQDADRSRREISGQAPRANRASERTVQAGLTHCWVPLNAVNPFWVPRSRLCVRLSGNSNH